MDTHSEDSFDTLIEEAAQETGKPKDQIALLITRYTRRAIRSLGGIRGFIQQVEHKDSNAHSSGLSDDDRATLDAQAEGINRMAGSMCGYEVAYPVEGYSRAELREQDDA